MTLFIGIVIPVSNIRVYQENDMKALRVSMHALRQDGIQIN